MKDETFTFQAARRKLAGTASAAQSPRPPYPDLGRFLAGLAAVVSHSAFSLDGTTGKAGRDRPAVALARLLRHPAIILPRAGSADPDRIAPRRGSGSRHRFGSADVGRTLQTVLGPRGGMTRMEPFTDRELRDAFGRFATGVTVVTTRVATGPLGITANSFASVSLDPPLVLWLPAKGSSRFAPFTECDFFAIHIMGAAQHTISSAFVREGDIFDELDWTEAPDGTPLIDDCLARFHCATHAVHDAGDHAIVVGRVIDAVHVEGEPLVFQSGRYGRFQSG